MAITDLSDISGLILDYDPHDGDVWTDTAGTTAAGVGDNVARIDDRSTSGNDATQATVSEQPTLQQDANGWRHLIFDATDDWLEMAAAVTPGDFTIVAVSYSDVGVSGQARILDSSANNNNFHAYRDDGTDFHCMVGGTNEIVPVSGFGVRHQLIIRRSGTSCEIYKRDVLQGTATVGTGTTHLDIVGVDGGGLQQLNGGIWRLGIYNKQLTSTELDDVNAYLDRYDSAPGGGAESISGSFDEATITSWAGTLSEAVVISGGFTEASVASWAGSVGEGTGISGSFDSVGVTSWAGAVSQGTAGESISGSFDEASVTSWAGSLSEGVGITGSFSEAATTTWAGSVGEGVGISGAFDSVPITAWSGTLEEAQVISGLFSAVGITSWAGALSEGQQSQLIDAYNIQGIPFGLPTPTATQGRKINNLNIPSSGKIVAKSLSKTRYHKLDAKKREFKVT